MFWKVAQTVQHPVNIILGKSSFQLIESFENNILQKTQKKNISTQFQIGTRRTPVETVVELDHQASAKMKDKKAIVRNNFKIISLVR